MSRETGGTLIHTVASTTSAPAINHHKTAKHTFVFLRGVTPQKLVEPGSYTGLCWQRKDGVFRHRQELHVGCLATSSHLTFSASAHIKAAEIVTIGFEAVESSFVLLLPAGVTFPWIRSASVLLNVSLGADIQETR